MSHLVGLVRISFLQALSGDPGEVAAEGLGLFRVACPSTVTIAVTNAITRRRLQF